MNVSPFKSEDGIVYIGKKSSKIVEINLESGHILHTFQGRRASSTFVSARLKESTIKKQQIVSIGRIDYELAIFHEDDLEHPKYAPFRLLQLKRWILDGM